MAHPMPIAIVPDQRRDDIYVILILNSEKHMIHVHAIWHLNNIYNLLQKEYTIIFFWTNYNSFSSTKLSLFYHIMTKMGI